MLMKIKKIDYKMIEKIVLLFSLIVFFEPQGFKEDFYTVLKKIDNIYKVMKIVCFVVVSYIYVKECIINKKMISKLLVTMAIFQMFCALTTVINSGDIIRFVGPAITTITMIMIAEILITNNMFETTLKNVNIYFRVLFILNVISIILVDYFDILPANQIYLLGIDNRWIFTYLPWITFEFIVAKIGGKGNKIPIICFILAELTLVCKFSVSALLCFSLWGLICFESINKFVAKTPIYSFIIVLLGNVLIVIFKVQNLFSYFLGKILKKGTSLSGRTYLWDKIIKDLPNYPFIRTWDAINRF